MDAKEYLKQAYYLDRRIESDLLEKASLRRLVLSVPAASLSEHHNPNHPTEAPFTRTLQRIWEMEQQIDDEVDALVDLKEEIRRTIDLVDDEECRLLLRHRYIHFEKWDDIAEVLGKSRRRVLDVHKEALEKVDKILEGQH